MKKLFSTTLAITVLTLATSLSAQTPFKEMPAGAYKLDKVHSNLTWKVSHLGLSKYTARFTSFDADLTYNPKNIEKSKIVATVNPVSIETDFPYPDKMDFDAELGKGEGWFNALKFPEVKFVSNKINLTGGNTGKMTGQLTLLGVTKPVSLDVILNGALIEQPFTKKPTLGFSASAILKRSEWGMETYLPAIGDEVELLIEAEFEKAK